ncbi:hypothetical protein B0H14DRAFT_3781958 [Mycena olivaceomarginata]|nr:hypothetical protein B0H14DRAFT_3781958 [Mycena olivaceomarginata]
MFSQPIIPNNQRHHHILGWLAIMAVAVISQAVPKNIARPMKVTGHSISRRGDERAALKTHIKYRIQKDLWDWVVQQPNEFIPLPENDRIDPHHDTPGELLHTYLLGNNKYVWHDLTKNWDDKKGDLFASRLQGSNLDSLSIPPPRARYVVQYKNSLIGKHFKMLQQLGVFHLHDLCTPLLFDLWKATGELGALLWYPEKNMELYLADLEILINNLLDIWGVIDPNRILVKGKLHVLAHTIDDIRRFGPSVIYATEIQECWNAIFRLCTVILPKLWVTWNGFKHMVSGGWWKNEDGKLGWSEKSRLQSGTVKLEASVKRHPSTWNLASPEPTPVGSNWLQQGFNIFRTQKPFAGRITKILARDGSTLTRPGNAVVVLDPFIVLDVKDKRLNMPILVPATENSTTVTVNANTDSVFIRQERILTDLTELQTKHSDNSALRAQIIVEMSRE